MSTTETYTIECYNTDPPNGEHEFEFTEDREVFARVKQIPPETWWAGLTCPVCGSKVKVRAGAFADSGGGTIPRAETKDALEQEPEPEE